MQTENELEIKKFTSFAKNLGNKNDGFQMLYKMNCLRFDYINSNASICNAKILDIGCGCGILSESLASIGGHVTAIDPCSKAVEVAQNLSQGNVKYINTSVVDFIEQKRFFDIVCVMEVIEHVKNLAYFLHLSASMVKKGGKIFFSTINKTLSSYLLAIVMAEYILKLMPKGPHSWKNFIKPSEMYKLLAKNKINVQDLSGIRYNPVLDSWSFTLKLDVNYIGYGTKI